MNTEKLEPVQRDLEIPTSVKDIEQLRRFLKMDNTSKETYFKRSWQRLIEDDE